jgi:hypothetical protein
VRAIDLDTGANGNVTYSLVKSTDQSSDRFDIDSSTGIVRTADVFDREAQIGVTDYGVTVKAEDQGSPTLAGFCTFRYISCVRCLFSVCLLARGRFDEIKTKFSLSTVKKCLYLLCKWS